VRVGAGAAEMKREWVALMRLVRARFLAVGQRAALAGLGLASSVFIERSCG
jgi:hypothetical protein